MITKTANALLGLVQHVVPIGLGSFKTSELTDEERAKLIKKHHLRNDANLALRNIGRGYVGAGLGASAGALLGGGLSTAVGLATEHPEIIPAGISLSTLLGGLYGANKATNKYSRSALEE